MGSLVLFSSLGVCSWFVEVCKLGEKMKKTYHKHSTSENHIQEQNNYLFFFNIIISKTLSSPLIVPLKIILSYNKMAKYNNLI